MIIVSSLLSCLRDRTVQSYLSCLQKVAKYFKVSPNFTHDPRLDFICLYIQRSISLDMYFFWYVQCKLFEVLYFDFQSPDPIPVPMINFSLGGLLPSWCCCLQLLEDQASHTQCYGSGMFIPDPGSGSCFLPLPDPGSRGQKGTWSRIRKTGGGL